jgi:hypothetical protein
MNNPAPISLDQLVQSFSKPPLGMPEPRSYGYAAPSYGPGVEEPQKTIEIRNPRGTNGAATVEFGAFYGLIADGGDIYLQGGTVTAGDNTIAWDAVKVVDGSTGPEGDPGDHLVLQCTGNGVVEDDVLMPGFNLTDLADAILDSGSIPENTLPTAASSTEKNAYISLGTFTSTGFAPARVGNIQIGFCPSSYNITRS